MIIFLNDNQLAEVSSKLGPILNIGEINKQQTKTDESTKTSSIDPAQKYTNISEGSDIYKREWSVASASKVGVNNETSRINSAASNYSNDGSSNANKTASTTEMMRKNFENF